jgi:hypothetical protein
MERPAVIRFFMLKRLKSRAVHTELELADGPEVFALPTMKR